MIIIIYSSKRRDGALVHVSVPFFENKGRGQWLLRDHGNENRMNDFKQKIFKKLYPSRFRLFELTHLDLEHTDRFN